MCDAAGVEKCLAFHVNTHGSTKNCYLWSNVMVGWPTTTSYGHKADCYIKQLPNKNLLMKDATATSTYPPRSSYRCCQASRVLDNVGDSFYMSNAAPRAWSASFVGGTKTVDRVRIRNRPTYETGLRWVNVYVGASYCGSLPSNTAGAGVSYQGRVMGKWYYVKCLQPLRGSTI